MFKVPTCRSIYSGVGYSWTVALILQNGCKTYGKLHGYCIICRFYSKKARKVNSCFYAMSGNGYILWGLELEMVLQNMKIQMVGIGRNESRFKIYRMKNGRIFFTLSGKSKPLNTRKRIWRPYSNRLSVLRRPRNRLNNGVVTDTWWPRASKREAFSVFLTWNRKLQWCRVFLRISPH